MIKFLSYQILFKLSELSPNICSINRHRLKWEWHETTRLFLYFCWYVTEIGETNGLRLYKGKRYTNLKAFQSFFLNPPDTDKDRNAIRDFKNRQKPKRFKEIQRATKEFLKTILNTNIKEIDFDKWNDTHKTE